MSFGAERAQTFISYMVSSYFAIHPRLTLSASCGHFMYMFFGLPYEQVFSLFRAMTQIKEVQWRLCIKHHMFHHSSNLLDCQELYISKNIKFPIKKILINTISFSCYPTLHRSYHPIQYLLFLNSMLQMDLAS